MSLLAGLVDRGGGVLRTYFLLIGVALVVAAIVATTRRLASLLAGETTTGHVVGHYASTIDESTTHHAIVEFRDWTNQTHRFTAGSGGGTRHPPEGATVRVRYQRANPKAAYISTFLHMWAGPLALALLGGAAIAAWWQ